MKTTRGTVTALVAVIFLLSLVCTPVMAEDKKTGSTEDTSLILVDMALVRPAGAAVTLVGAALFIIWSPVGLVTQTTEDAWNKLVVEPARYTFTRPLGET